jgi:kynurenine formamidase
VKIFDLSQPVGRNACEPVAVLIDYLSHEDGASILGADANLTAEDFPDGYAISMEVATISTHTATHIDAPLHYGPICEGKPAKSVDALPLKWFFGPGIMLSFRSDPELGPITSHEMQMALKSLPVKLEAGTIVLCNVGAALLWGSKEYFLHYRGISPQAIELLLDHGARLVGTDAFGIDPPFQRMLEGYCASKDKSVLWPAHMLGRRREYCQIERLGGLDLLPRPYGFKVACFPIRLEKCGASWTRAVAIFEDFDEADSASFAKEASVGQ